MEYITPEHYETAEKNGIPRRYVYNRFWNSGWDIEKCITEPVKKRKTWMKKKYCPWAQVWEKQSPVSRATFYHRMKNLGWSEEEAAMIPPHGKRGER